MPLPPAVQPLQLAPAEPSVPAVPVALADKPADDNSLAEARVDKPAQVARVVLAQPAVVATVAAVRLAADSQLQGSQAQCIVVQSERIAARTHTARVAVAHAQYAVNSLPALGQSLAHRFADPEQAAIQRQVVPEPFPVSAAFA